MKNRQQGFSIVEVVVVISVLILVTAVGSFVWFKNKKVPAANTVITSLKSESYSGTRLSLKFFGKDSPSSGLVSFVVPDGWIADKDSGNGLFFFADTLTYKPGSKFSYSDQVNTKDIDRFMLSYTDANAVPKEYATYKQSDFGSVIGHNTVLYYHEFSKGEHIGNVQMQGGEKEYMYFINKLDSAVLISYFVFAGDQNQKQLIDQVVHSVKF